MAGASQIELALHHRLLQGDVTAPAELAGWCLRPLLVSLRARFRGIKDDDLLHTAVTDAVLNYIREPAAYDPSKRSLLGYLRMSAAGDLLNAMRRNRRVRKVEIAIEDVEEGADTGNKTVGDRLRLEVEDALISKLDGRRRLAIVNQTIDNPTDRKFLALMIAGERKTDAFAKVLGVTDFDAASQRRVVKRAKDRLIKQLQRAKKGRREQ